MQQPARSRTWQPERSFAWVVAVLAVVVAIFWRTSWSMVELWNSSGTYSHGFLILPAFLWLVWDRRHALARLPIRPCWFALFALAAMGLVWLLGDLASAALPAQIAVVAMVPAAVAVVLGVSWARALAFPLAFLFFAVPFGDSLVPVMMDWTADFTVAALKLSGVPVYRDGLHFAIPSGNWSVVDSCSGIRYLFACLTAATLYGWIVYRSTTRRLLFIGCALVIAVVANWIRAYAIVMLGHLSNNRIATGADHLVYGWLFFGVIMTIIFALGALWREDLPGEAAADGSDPASAREVPAAPAARESRRSFAAACAAALTMLIWPLVSLGTAGEPHRDPGSIGDIQPRAGWVRVEEPATSWQPRLRNPAALLLQSFEKDARRVSVQLGVFYRPTPDSKLTTSSNRLLEPDGANLHWKLTQRGVAQARRGGEVIAVSTGMLVGRDARVVAWHWYWVDGTLTTSPTRAALAQMLARLRGHSERSAWVAVYTTEGEDMASAPLVLEVFLSDMLDSIDQALGAPMPARPQRLTAVPAQD